MTDTPWVRTASPAAPASCLTCGAAASAGGEAPIDVDEALERMAPPPRSADASVPIDTRGVELKDRSVHEAYYLQTDLLQNHQDLASPPTLWQGAQEDCYLVATLNAVARSPHGQAHLKSLVTPLGDDRYRVTLRDANGAPYQTVVWLGDGAVMGTGNVELMAIERAVVYADAAANGVDGAPGGYSHKVMAQLGLAGGEYPASDALRQEYGGAAYTLNTSSGRTVHMDRYRLDPEHSYAVVGVVTAPNGTPTLVLQNPLGRRHPITVDAADVPRVAGADGYASRGE